MINDLTFHFSHIGLVFVLLIFLGCIYSWNTFSHVFYYRGFLDVVHSLHFISSVREILVHVVFFTSPTLDWWSSPFSLGVFFIGFILIQLILLIFIRLVSLERRLESLYSLTGILPLLIPPIFLQLFSTLALFIHVFSLSNGLCQISRLTY
jgi:hypothetical protein